MRNIWSEDVDQVQPQNIKFVLPIDHLLFFNSLSDILLSCEPSFDCFFFGGEILFVLF